MRKLYIWLLFVAGVILFALFLRTFDWTDMLRIVITGNHTYLTIYLCASIAIIVLHSLRWRVVLQAKKLTIPIHNVVSYQFIRHAVSFVTPGPKISGDATRAGLLSRHTVRGQKIRLTRALPTVLLDRTVELQTFAALFFFMVVWFAFFGELPKGIQAILMVLSTLLLVFVIIFAVNVRRGRLLFVRILRKFNLSAKVRANITHFEKAIISFYRTDRKDFMFSHLIAACAWFMSFVEYKFLLLLLGIDMPLYGVFIVYSFVGLAYMLPVPLALGTLEASQAAAFTILGLAPATGIALALITRTRDILFALAGFIMLGYYGITTKSIPKTVRP
jgi:glycosyltransferase 2 family protein